MDEVHDVLHIILLLAIPLAKSFSFAYWQYWTNIMHTANDNDVIRNCFFSPQRPMRSMVGTAIEPFECNWTFASSLIRRSYLSVIVLLARMPGHSQLHLIANVRVCLCLFSFFYFSSLPYFTVIHAYMRCQCTLHTTAHLCGLLLQLMLLMFLFHIHRCWLHLKTTTAAA